MKRFRSFVGRSDVSLTPSARFAPAVVRPHYKVVAVHVGVQPIMCCCIWGRDYRDRQRYHTNE